MLDRLDRREKELDFRAGIVVAAIASAFTGKAHSPAEFMPRLREQEADGGDPPQLLKARMALLRQAMTLAEEGNQP